MSRKFQILWESLAESFTVGSRKIMPSFLVQNVQHDKVEVFPLQTGPVDQVEGKLPRFLGYEPMD